MTLVELCALIFGAGGVGSLITQFWVSRKSVRVEEFKVITDALNVRIDDLTQQVAELKGSLRETRRRYHAALRYIRANTAWLMAGQVTDPPEIPADVLEDV